MGTIISKILRKDSSSMDVKLLPLVGNIWIKLLVEVEEAYGHCPRAFAFSELWNEKRIASNAALPRRI